LDEEAGVRSFSGMVCRKVLGAYIFGYRLRTAAKAIRYTTAVAKTGINAARMAFPDVEPELRWLPEPEELEWSILSD